MDSKIMDDQLKRKLVLRHAQLVAAYAATKDGQVLAELEQIEAELQMNAVQIAQLAVDQYMRDY